MERRKVPNYTSYSLFGGAFASFGSFLGKLSGTYHESWFGFAFFLLAMVSANTLGCLLFVKALNLSSSSLQPTIISTASNYLVTAILGTVVYKEATPPLWWTGTFLVLVGILVISYPRDKPKVE